MSEITENILNLIFCVRQTHTMLITGLVKSLSWLPIVHRLGLKASSLTHKGLWNLPLHRFFFLETIFFFGTWEGPVTAQQPGIQLGMRRTSFLLSRDLNEGDESPSPK